MDVRYKIVYRKKRSIGDAADAVDETLMCKDLQLISLLAILVDNNYQIKSVKLMEDKNHDLQNQ